MEIVKPRKDLLFIVGTGFLVLGLFVFISFTPFLQGLFYGHWGFLVLALTLAFFPQAKKPFTGVREYSRTAWLAQIFLMQMSLFALHVGISTQPYAETLTQYGLFPWGWVAVLASAFASTAYFQKENAFGSSLLSPFIKTTAEKPFGIIINNILKFAQSVVLIFTFASMILLIASFLGFNLSFPFSEPLPLLGIFILIIFSFTKFYKRLITRLSALPAYYMIFIFIAIVSALLAGLHALSSHLQFTLPLPSFLTDLQAYPQDILSPIISLSWWLCFSILASLFVARISRGYSRQSMIGAILILPAVFALFSLVFPTWQENAIPMRNLFAILGFISCMILFTRTKMLSPLVLNYLPKNGESKFRNPEFLLRKLIQMSLIFLYFYLPLGPIMSAVFLFVGTFPLLFFAVLLLIRQLQLRA